MSENEPVSEADLEQLVVSKGLIVAALTLQRVDRKNEALVAALVRGASRRNVLMSDGDVDALAALTGTRFFDVQILLNEVIPRLEARPSDVMRLVETLIEKGGNDLAANQPNAAFRTWCRMDPSRADAVIAEARAGDTRALDHLVFALEARGNVEEAFRSARAESQERTAGILALSRMSLSQDEADRAIKFIFALAATVSADEAVSLLKATLDIADRHTDLDRGPFCAAFRRLSASTGPGSVHLMATALVHHLKHMSPTEIDICLEGVAAVDPSNLATVDEIDNALYFMWDKFPDRAAQAASRLISMTGGRVGAEQLDGFFHAAGHGDPGALGRMATSWLLEGDYDVCSTLILVLSEVNRTEPCLLVDPSDLPATAEAQTFLCRKSVGFLFLSPMTAASWIVAVLRGGHPDAAQEAAGLLLDPLLMNYGGALKDWLETVAHSDGHDGVREALDLAQVVWDGTEAARDVVELKPSMSRRAVVRFMEAEEAEKIREGAHKRSIFAQIATTQNLLYGDKSSFRTLDGTGGRRSQTTHMTQFSVRSELPQAIFFDPVGLDRSLEMLRREERPKT